MEFLGLPIFFFFFKGKKACVWYLVTRTKTVFDRYRAFYLFQIFVAFGLVILACTEQDISNTQKINSMHVRSKYKVLRRKIPGMRSNSRSGLLITDHMERTRLIYSCIFISTKIMNENWYIFRAWRINPGFVRSILYLHTAVNTWQRATGHAVLSVCLFFKGLPSKLFYFKNYIGYNREKTRK